MFRSLVSIKGSVNSLPEITTSNANEEIIFSNYKISAFDEGFSLFHKKWRFITANF